MNICTMIKPINYYSPAINVKYSWYKRFEDKGVNMLFKKGLHLILDIFSL